MSEGLAKPSAHSGHGAPPRLSWGACGSRRGRAHSRRPARRRQGRVAISGFRPQCGSLAASRLLPLGRGTIALYPSLMMVGNMFKQKAPEPPAGGSGAFCFRSLARDEPDLQQPDEAGRLIRGYSVEGLVQDVHVIAGVAQGVEDAVGVLGLVTEGALGQEELQGSHRYVHALEAYAVDRSVFDVGQGVEAQ